MGQALKGLGGRGKEFSFDSKSSGNHQCVGKRMKWRQAREDLGLCGRSSGAAQGACDSAQTGMVAEKLERNGWIQEIFNRR